MFPNGKALHSGGTEKWYNHQRFPEKTLSQNHPHGLLVPRRVGMPLENGRQPYPVVTEPSLCAVCAMFFSTLLPAPI